MERWLLSGGWDWFLTSSLLIGIPDDIGILCILLSAQGANVSQDVLS